MALSSDKPNSPGINFIDGKAFLKLPQEESILVDVRPFYELNRLFDVPNLIFLPYTEIQERWEEIPGRSSIVIADAVGLRSSEVAEVLMEKGLSGIHILTGGIVEWDRAGLPVTTDRKRTLSGSCMCQLKIR